MTTLQPNTPGRRQLVALMRKAKWGPNEMAARVQADHGQISRIVSRKQRPGLDLAVAIERATGIPVSDWAVL